MQNQQHIIANPSLSYSSGWFLALRNFNVLEIDSIRQLINLHDDNRKLREPWIKIDHTTTE